MERAVRFSSGEKPVGLVGFRARALGVDGDDAVDRLVERGDAREEVLERLSARDPSSTDRIGEIRGGDIGEIGQGSLLRIVRSVTRRIEDGQLGAIVGDEHGE